MSGEDEKVTVWKYFAKGEHLDNAKCLLCSAVLKISQRSRKGLVTHLKSKHFIELKSNPSSSQQNTSIPSTSSTLPDNEGESIIPKRRPKITDFFLKRTAWK